jgi:hypothetical protein
MNFGVTGDAAPNAAFIERGKVLLRGSGRGFLDLLGLPFAAWNRALLVGIGGDKACVDRKSIGAHLFTRLDVLHWETFSAALVECATDSVTVPLGKDALNLAWSMALTARRSDLTGRRARTPLQEGFERCRERDLHRRFYKRAHLGPPPRDAINHILQLLFNRVGEHRRALRNIGLRSAHKLTLLGRRSLSKHARRGVHK